MAGQDTSFQAKIRVARAQLGTALDLFIRHKDPVSVQVLACGASELIEGLSEQADLPTLSTHIMANHPDIDMRRIRGLRNQYWNAFKHFYDSRYKAAREDEALIADFSDRSNDAVLFMAWGDYLRLVGRIPIEAQVLQIWFSATNEGKMAAGVDPTPWRSLFPGIEKDDRAEQKRRLREACEKYAKNREIKFHPKTEPGPLVVSAEHP